MPKDFIDLWAFGVVGVPTSGKELSESIRYTKVISVDPHQKVPGGWLMVADAS